MGGGESRYTKGSYLEHNPSWHVEDSAWKADHIVSMMRAHDLRPRSIAEVGCGAGEILRILHDTLGEDVTLVGYEVSPQAIELARPRATERLRFELADIGDDASAAFDLALVMDVIEHLEDPFAFLRRLRGKADLKILHIPLDLSAVSVARPHALLGSRREVGHVQYFVRETALAVLTDAGYEVLDARYTYTGGRPRSLKALLLYALRRLARAINPDAGVRLLGGHSLLVLAR